jgi:hypothetical protein
MVQSLEGGLMTSNQDDSSSPIEPKAEMSPATSTRTDAKGQVKAWLDSHGVALEMRVAAAFRRELQSAGIWSNVDHGRIYVADDSESGSTKLREADVVVRATRQTTFSEVWFNLWLVAECKSSTKDPWVLYRGSWRSQPSPLTTFAEGWEIRASDDFNANNVGGWTDERLLNSTHMNYCYSIASTNNPDRNGNSKNHARDAVLQVLSAVKGVAKDTPVQAHHLTAAIFVPVIVTSAPLIVVTLLDDGTYRLDDTSRELLVGRFNSDETSARAIWVVNDQEIDHFAAEYASAVTRLDYRV